MRPVRSDEADALSALALTSKAFWGYSQEFMETCRAELTYDAHQIASENFEFTVCQLSDRVVGFYGIECSDDNQPELCALFVEPEYIGQGYGHLLIEAAKRRAGELGAECLIVQGDPNAESFYKAAGGICTGQSESGSVPGRFLPLFRIDLV